MYTQNAEEFPPPPGIINSLRAGFEAVSGHVILILLPAVLDILLWLGPHLRIDGLLTPVLSLAFSQTQITLTSANDVDRIAQLQSMFSEVMERFNLLSLLGRLQTSPIGISSLLAQTMPVRTPLGSQQVVQVSSGLGLITWVFLLIVTGWILGGLYFRWVSETALGITQGGTGISFLRAISQTLLLSALWMVGLSMILVPVLMMLTVLTMINAALAAGAVFILLVMSFWLIVPLFFTPHGIFVSRQNAFSSVFSSLRMARFTLPTSGLFVLCVFVLTTGLNYLWSIPPEDSWMTLVGIAGHAFITTALLAASFVYYRDMNVWLQTVLERLQKKQGIPTRRV